MKTDNQWHPGVVAQRPGTDRFVLADSLQGLPGGGRYQDVLYNWNSGKPLVDFGDFVMAIADVRAPADNT